MTVQTSPEPHSSALSYDRQQLEDIGFLTCMTLVLLGQLRADRPFRRAPGLHAVQRRRPSGRPRAGRAALRLPAAQAPLRRQVHAGGRPLRADLLRAVDDHGPGAGPQVRGDRRPAVLRDAGRRDAADRRARLPPRRGRVEDPAVGRGPRRRSAVRAGEGPRHQGAVRAHRVAPTSPTTSTAAPPASASRRRRARPPSGTSSARRRALPKIVAFEGEFAMCAGHAQELKTQALALKVGKRLRIMLSEQQCGHRRRR